MISSPNVHLHCPMVSFVWQYAYEFYHCFRRVVVGLLLRVANESGYPCVFSPAKYTNLKQAIANRHPDHIIESFEVTFSHHRLYSWIEKCMSTGNKLKELLRQLLGNSNNSSSFVINVYKVEWGLLEPAKDGFCYIFCSIFAWAAYRARDHVSNHQAQGDQAWDGRKDKTVTR